MDHLSRRHLLKVAAACGSIGSLGLSAPAIGQGLTKVSFTTSWIPEGPNLFAYVARDKGFWKKNGLDVSVARGSGSGAAAQAVGAGGRSVARHLVGQTLGDPVDMLDEPGERVTQYLPGGIGHDFDATRYVRRDVI